MIQVGNAPEGYEPSEFTETLLSLREELREEGVTDEQFEAVIEEAAELAAPIVGPSIKHIVEGRGKAMSQVADLILIGIVVHRLIMLDDEPDDQKV